MAEADALALLKLLPQAGIDIDPQRDLARFTDFAVQIRYDHQPDPQNLERSRLVMAITPLGSTPAGERRVTSCYLSNFLPGIEQC
jgi:hypothetical protein